MRCARKLTSVKQPKWHSLSTSSTACWRWDARATSASYETTRTGDHCVHRLIHATRSHDGVPRRASNRPVTRQGGEVQCRHPEGAPTPPASKAVKMGALSVSCALSSL